MERPYVRLVSVVGSVLIVAVSGLQIALALGLPFGDATFGGAAPTEDGVLSPAFRVIALINALVLLLFARVILVRGQVWPSRIVSEPVAYWFTWAIVVFLGINTIGNLSATHPFERFVIGAVTIVLVLLCGYVALKAPRSVQTT